MNKSAVERGLFVSTVFKTYREQNNKNYSTGEEEFFCKPDEATSSLKPYKYDKLGSDGFVPEDSFVEAGDVIIGKCMPQKSGNAITNKDTSVVLKTNEKGYVDRCGVRPLRMLHSRFARRLASLRTRTDGCTFVGSSLTKSPNPKQFQWV